MIRPPHRSVTRFFIPLIDVLILLFCIFLLMPYVKPTDVEPADTAARAPVVTPAPDAVADDVTRLRSELERAGIECDRLQERLDSVLKRLAIRVLEIDPNSGRLYYFDPDRIRDRVQTRTPSS